MLLIGITALSRGKEKKPKAGLQKQHKESACTNQSRVEVFRTHALQLHPTTALIWAPKMLTLLCFSVSTRKLKERTAYRGRYEDDGEQYGGIDEQAILNYLDDETSIVYTSARKSDAPTLCIYRSYIAQSNTIDINKFKLNQKLIGSAMTGTHAPNMVADTQFPVDAAHRLYTDLFSGLTECLYGRKKALWIPSNDIRNIPISALITHRDKHLEGTCLLGLGRLPWLSKKVAFAVSPTVISLTTNTNPFGLYTRELPFLGMGDPALDESSKTSLSNQLTTRGLLNTGGVDVSLLSELPNTRNELRNIATLITGDAKLIFGNEASELNLRKMLDKGAEAISFATHGVIAGELENLSESALVLTPKSKNNSDDDGLLTASEIADLSISTNFVSLSACNTAIYDTTFFQEETQGLTNGFLLAGAQTVLASRWPVETNAAQRLNERIFSFPKFKDGEYALAVQSAQMSMLSNDQDIPRQHPRFWSSFVLYGRPDRTTTTGYTLSKTPTETYYALGSEQLPSGEVYTDITATKDGKSVYALRQKTDAFGIISQTPESRLDVFDITTPNDIDVRAQLSIPNATSVHATRDSLIVVTRTATEHGLVDVNAEIYRDSTTEKISSIQIARGFPSDFIGIDIDRTGNILAVVDDLNGNFKLISGTLKEPIELTETSVVSPLRQLQIGE